MGDRRPSRDETLHLGGPDDDHYARLGEWQPLLVGRAWARLGNWLPGTEYELREALAMIARHRDPEKGKGVRDLRKAAFLLQQAADVLEECLASSPLRVLVNGADVTGVLLNGANMTGKVDGIWCPGCMMVVEKMHNCPGGPF